MTIDYEKEELASRLRGSLLEFTRFFFKHITGRDFIVSRPVARESHHIVVCRELTKLFRLQTPNHRLIINLPPGYGKSILVSHWIAWAMASYPDSNFIYISYSHDLAAKHTSFIKNIISSEAYSYLFGIGVKRDSRAKDYFQTEQGGTVKAYGSGGSITGQDAGLPGLDRFSGAVIIDDPIKPDDGLSEAVRTNVVNNYQATIRTRLRGINVPMVFIGQRVHEQDLAAFLLGGNDTTEWESIVLKALDPTLNSLYPEVSTVKALLALQEKSPYVFSSQYQQDPLPAGGAIFKESWFYVMDEEPNILTTFITADTAETDKSWNDATVFSFWGLYEIETMGRKTGEMGLHWLDCLELTIEPKDLKEAFMDFYANCSRHKNPPLMAAIEKKSTGVTLVSTLKELRGISIREINRTSASGSKAQRFLEIQPYVASKRISFTKGDRHIDVCITHMGKITPNNSHRWDDVCYVANTKIATIRGDINIQDIKIGDKVITPFGLGRVKACGSTGFRRVIKNIGLEGTPNHPVFNVDKFSPLDTLTDSSKIDRLNIWSLLLWTYKKLLYSMVSPIGSWGRNDIILVNQIIIKRGSVPKDFMQRFGNFIAEKRYRKAMLFIIRTTITLITILAIWNAYRGLNILRDMKRILENGMTAWKVKNISRKFRSFLKNGIKVMPELLGIERMQKLAVINCKNSNVSFVKMNFMADPQSVDSAHMNASKRMTQQEPEKFEQEKEVFNLTVETYGVYYAHGILVSNCDTLVDAVQIGLIEKSIAIANAPNAALDAFSRLQSSHTRALNNIMRESKGNIW